MSRFEELTVSLPDGYEAYARYWPAGTPRGAVLLHHGIQSHCGWYEGSPARLAEAGYAVLQMDRRGCGRNEKDRGHAESQEQLIEDALTARDVLLTRSGCSRYHVVGVSWGGKLAVAVYVRAPEAVASLTLVTPGLFPRIGVSREERARIGFAMLYEPLSRFDIPLNEPDLFTHVPKWQRFFREDPLTLRACTASFYLASRRMDRTVSALREAPPVPIHLMLAGEEHIIDNERTASFLEGLGWPDVRITRYEHARHSLEFDVPEAFFRDLVAFLDGVEQRGAG